MRKRFLPILAFLCLTAVSPMLRAADAPVEPTLVLRVRSIDGLIADIKYLATLAGAEEEAKQLEGVLKARIGPKGFEGLDTKRSLGLHGMVGPNGLDSTVVVLLPVADEKAFLNLLDTLNYKANRGDDGVFTVQSKELPVPVYFRFANKYAHVTLRDKTGIAKDKLLDPAKVLPGADAGLLALTAHIDRIPDGLKKVAIQQLDEQIANLKEQKPADETPPQKKLREESIKEYSKQLAAVINEGGEFSIRLDIDRKANEISTEISLGGKKGSKLAANLSDLGQARSVVAGMLGADSAMNALLHLSLPESIRQAMGPVLDEGVQKALDGEPDKAKRAVAEKFLKAILPALKAGELDAGFTFRGPGPGKHYAMVAGIKVKDGDAIGKTVYDLFKEIPATERDKIKLDAESAGTVKIHRIDAGKELDANARRLFGETPLYVAIRSDVLLLAFGEGSLSALKEAIAAQSKPGPLFQFEMSLSRFAVAMAQDPQFKNLDLIKTAQDAFGKDKESDKFRVSLEGGNSLKVRLAMKGPVLKFLADIGRGGAAGK